MNRAKLTAMALVIAAGLGLALAGQPTPADRLGKLKPSLAAQLAAETVRLDPGEVYDLMHNNNLRLILLDVRAENDYNLFHIEDAQRFDPQRADYSAYLDLPPETVIVVMSNGECAAEQAWELLSAAGARNVYLLGGGVNLWLDVYRDGRTAAPLPRRGTLDETLQHSFVAALGAEQPAAHPDPFSTPKRAYQTKVKLAGAAHRPSGGCG